MAKKHYARIRNNRNESVNLNKEIEIMTKKQGEKSMGYYLSLPERSIRAGAALLTGVTNLATETLLPKLVKDSVTYRVTFGMLQQFITTKIAGIEKEAAYKQMDDQYVLKKTAGSIVEGIGLFSIRFSPVWMLAILSDITGGTKVYLKRLVEAYKKEGILEEDEGYDNFLDLLEGLSKTSELGLTAFDMPPISKAEFLEYKKALQENMSDQKNTASALFRDLEGLWNRMITLEQKEAIDISEISGAMAISAMKVAGAKGFLFTKSTVNVTYATLHEQMIGPYKETLDEMGKVGFARYSKEQLIPHISKAIEHYDTQALTYTQKFGRFIRKKLFRR